MKRILLHLLLMASIIFFNGCGASKTPLASLNSKADGYAMIIGTFSRDIGSSYIKENRFSIINSNNKLVKNVFDIAKEHISLKNNPYEFNNDFVYKNSQGSIFAVYVPVGNYYINNFFAGRGQGGYSGEYSKQINLENGDIMYIGDIYFKPILKAHPLYENKIVIDGAQCIISNNFDRDYSIFKKHLNHISFQKNKIKIAVKTNNFELGDFYSDFNALLYIQHLIN